jgi:transcriptional regulator with XRE-family HTH domain
MKNNAICPACQVTRLSRYSPDPVCAACLRASWDSQPQAPLWLWDSEPIREAFARLDLGAVVAILRAAMGLSQIDFANLMSDGWSQTTVSDIERRKRGTLYDIRELLRFADTLDMPREALLPLVFGDANATLEKNAIPEPAGDIDVNRRSFTTLAAGLAAGATLPPIQIPNRIGDTHVRYLWAGLDRLRSREQVNGGGAIIGEAVRLFARARAMLDESDYSERVGRELLAVAAEIGNAAGWAAFDQEEHALARQLYSAAALLADSADSPEVAVHLYTNLAQQSAELAVLGRSRRGRVREALMFAGRAAQAARHEPSPKLHALIALRQARAYAELGDERGFRAAITTARRDLDRGPHPTDPQWTSYVSGFEIVGYEAIGYEALACVRNERNGRVAAMYREVLDDPDPARSPLDHANYRSRLARALAEEGDSTEAIAEGQSLLPDLGERIISNRVLNRLRPVRAAAETAAAEEFCTRFDAAERALRATPPPTA